MTPGNGTIGRMDDIASRDQAAAREREFDRRAQRWAARFLLASAVLGLYALLAAMGVLPAMPWSALGQ